MKLKYRITSLILLLCIIFSVTGCDLTLVMPEGSGSSGTGDVGNGGSDSSGGGSGESDAGESGSGGEVIFPEDDVEKLPDGWDNTAPIGITPVYLMRGDSVDLTGYIEGELPSSGVTFESRCPSVASVSGSTLTGESVGRTEVVATYKDGEVATFAVTVEFMISTAGYDFVTDKKDGETHKVTSTYEANRILDLAIAGRYHSVSLDFSLVSESFDVVRDFDLEIELGSHAKLKILYYESTPYKAEFEIVYNSEAASETTPLTEENTYAAAASANMIARRAFAEAAGVARADDFDGFAIYEANRELEVYNSEELWWAVEQGYLPVFPKDNTKAELFFERAKMILREIIHDGMSDYDKVIAIYEYLVDAVAYDYDAYARAGQVTAGGNEEAISALKNDTCYYLEGVFERGRAVCDGKTKAFVLLCGIEGIPALRISGSSITGGVGHAWNYVNIDGVWYLVDTTEGDARYSAGSGIAAFFGSNVETVSYSALLAPLDYHEDSYLYGEVWSSITNGEGAVSADYFDSDLLGTDYDFIIDSALEVEEIFKKLVSYGIEDKFTFTFLPADESDVFGYFRGVRDAYGLNMQIFTVRYGETKVYIALFDGQT